MCAARFAPFGTDVQPNIRVKIIGGKQVVVATETPPQSAFSDASSTPRERQDDSAVIPHGNNVLGGYATAHQHDRARKIPSQSADVDKYNSQIHSTGYNRNGFLGGPNVLPPIRPHARPNPLSWPEGDEDEDNYMDADDNEDYEEEEERSPTPDPLANIGRSNYTMSDELRHSLKEFDPSSFQDIYTDALEYDTRFTGYISQPQMNMLCLRHRLPINSSMLRVLFSSFAMDDNMDVVNYEKMIKYLAKVQIGSEQADTLLDEVLNRFMETRGDPVDKTSNLEKHIAQTMHTHDYDDARENKENKTKKKKVPTATLR